MSLASQNTTIFKSTEFESIHQEGFLQNTHYSATFKMSRHSYQKQKSQPCMHFGMQSEMERMYVLKMRDFSVPQPLNLQWRRLEGCIVLGEDGMRTL